MASQSLHTGARAGDRGSGLMYRLDARAKIVGFIGFAVVIVSTPARSVWAFGAYAAILLFLVGLARLGIRFVLRRLLIVIPFVIVVAIFIPFFDRAGSGGYSLGAANVTPDGLLVLWNAAAKAILGVLCMIILGATTGLPDMLEGFRRLRVPQVFVLIVSFMHRYVSVFRDELGRMQRAMVARNYRARWLWNAPTLGRMLGSLFLRSYSRGERVYVAMVSRGYEGSIALHSATVFGRAEVLFIVALAVVLALVRVAASL